MGSEETNREKMLFLDFHEKLPSELLQNKVFIRLANLQEKNPLIQINDLIFKGTYDFSVGTNLFFKKSKNEDPLEFPFDESPSFKLEFANSETKILSCKQMKVRSTTVQLPTNQEPMKFNFKWDYKELLKKLEDGTLDLQDMVKQKEVAENDISNEKNPTVIEENEPAVSMEIGDDTEKTDHTMDISEIKHMEVSIAEPTAELKQAYDDLKVLARTPVKREKVFEECPCDPRFKNEYEYRSIECKILEPPLFSYMKEHHSEKYDLNDCVNIGRCVTLGLLSPADVNSRIKSDKEKIIMNVENFENLDLRARYSVLISHMEELQKQVSSNTSEQNNMKDEFGRTPVDTLEIYKKLKLSLEQRIQEIYMNK